MGVGLANDNPKRSLQKSSAFESKKLAVSVLEQRFAHKMEHVPLKKRVVSKHPLSSPLQSPSPDIEESLSFQSQNPSPYFEESEQNVESKCAPSHFNQKICTLDRSVTVKSARGADGVRNGTMSEVTSGVIGCSEGLSGIELLAVVAYSGSISEDDDPNVEASIVKEIAAERVEISSAATEIEEIMVSLEQERTSENDLVKNVDNSDGSLVQDNSVVLSHNFQNNNPVCSNELRLHWDLNIPMDQWEDRCDNTVPKINDSRSVLEYQMHSGNPLTEVFEVQGDFVETRHDTGSTVQALSCGMASSDPYGHQMLIDTKCMLTMTEKHSIDEHILKVCSVPISDEENSITSPTEHIPKPLNYAAVETNARTPVISVNASPLNCFCPESNRTKSTCVNENIFGTIYQESCKSYGDGPTSCSSKLTWENHVSDCYVSNVSQDTRGHTLSVENMRELQAGYDSPFEDGELREDVVHSWEDNGVQDGETGNNGLAIFKTKACGGNQFIELHEDANAEGIYDDLDHKSLASGEFGSRESKASHINGLSFNNLHPRESDAFMPRHRSEKSRYSYSRAERNFRHDKSLGRGGFSFPACGSYWDTRNKYDHGYYQGHGYSRPRGVLSISAAGVNKMYDYDDRSLNDSSEGMYRPFTRRRSPADRGDSYGNRWRSPPSRGVDHDRIQARSGIYPRHVRRGPKEEYNDRVPVDADESIRVPHYRGRRQRSFSPNFSRGFHFSSPHRKARSRSRSRSPFAWQLQKGQRSPARVFRWDHRYDSMEYYTRSTSDDKNRSLMHREKFSHLAGAYRGHKFEDTDDDRRKHRDKYEIHHRVRRHHDAGGTMRRFRHDAEDHFEPENSHNMNNCSRSSLRTDVRSSAREKRDPIESERICTGDSPAGKREDSAAKGE